jgi:hypothetical protein
MMIAFVDCREKQWAREQTAESWLAVEARSSRAPLSRSVLVRFVLALFVTGLLVGSQLDAAHAGPIPVCSQTSLSAIRPDLGPPLPRTGKFCGIYPVHPPIPADATDSEPNLFELPGLSDLWAIVFDLLADLAEATSPPAAR